MDKSAPVSASFLEEYSSARPLYERLGRTVEGILGELLRSGGIEFLSISSRAKTTESAGEKLRRKPYEEPFHEMTDLCGVRIVTYLRSDVERVRNLVQDTFQVDPAHSIDKGQRLAVDRVGYRSVHLICALGAQRIELAEYLSFRDLKFEIQIRTALEHAWAQVEHGRNYKFGGVLPPELQRRLHLAAGALELIDQEFDRIAMDVDTYTLQVTEKTREGDLAIGVDTASLRVYLEVKARALRTIRFAPFELGFGWDLLLEELRAFGVNTLADVDEILTPDFFRARDAHPHPVSTTNEFGLLRDAMMYSDIERYFDAAYDNHWGGLDSGTYNLLVEKYGVERVGRVLSRHGVLVLEDENYESEEDDDER